MRRAHIYQDMGHHRVFDGSKSHHRHASAGSRHGEVACLAVTSGCLSRERKRSGAGPHAHRHVALHDYGIRPRAARRSPGHVHVHGAAVHHPRPHGAAHRGAATEALRESVHVREIHAAPHQVGVVLGHVEGE